MVTKIHVAVINASSVVTDDEVKALVTALQIQVDRDFEPAWGIGAYIEPVPKGGRPEPGAWWLVILDNSDQAGALGYHDLTNEGLPLSKVFAKSDMDYGAQWTVTASHELLEMLADPDIDLTVFDQPTGNTGTLYAYEVCDACEADDYGYAINGVLVSDFVYPAWFESFRQPKSTQFDHAHKISQPFALLPGGYIGVFDVTAGTGWSQKTAEEVPLRYDMRPRVGSRRERRKTPRNHWLKSQVHHPGHVAHAPAGATEP
jgi:hypothetical protein